MSLLSIKKESEALPAFNFFRVHNSFIVALDKINSIERDRIKIGEMPIPIIKAIKKDFYNKINNRFCKQYK